jgi:hypothetical protein
LLQRGPVEGDLLPVPLGQTSCEGKLENRKIILIWLKLIYFGWIHELIILGTIYYSTYLDPMGRKRVSEKF